MPKIINTGDKMAIAFCVENHIPIPSVIRTGKKKVSEMFSITKYTLLGKWETGGEYRLSLEYKVQATHEGTWYSYQRSIKLSSFKVMGPYVWNNTQTRKSSRYYQGAEWVNVALPLGPDFWPGAINNCTHAAQLHIEDGTVLCGTCGAKLVLEN